MEGDETKKNGGIELDWDKLNIDENENENEAYHYEMLRPLSDVEILVIFKRYVKELERRKLLRLKDDGGCKKPNPLDISTSVDASDSCREGDAPSRSSSQSKFAACFVNKLDEHRTEYFTPDAYEKQMSRETPFPSDGNLSGDTKKRNVSDSPRLPSSKRQRISSLQGQTSSHERHGNGEHVVEELEAETMATKEDRIGERDDFEDIKISCSDIQSLDPPSYLSSTTMNFYIRYLQVQTSPSGSGTGGCNFFLCNTYFYEKLKEHVTGKSMEEDPFAKLRQWWERVNKSERAYVLLPIHGRLGSLVIICMPDKARQSEPIMLLHLDPFGVSSNLVFPNIRRLLTDGIFVKQEARDPSLEHSPRIIEIRAKVPEARQICDCCLYVLFFMKKFIAEAPRRPKKMFGRRWFTHEEARRLRSEINTLLEDAFKNSTENDFKNSKENEISVS